jgi:hypothetical protein
MWCPVRGFPCLLDLAPWSLLCIMMLNMRANCRTVILWSLQTSLIVDSAGPIGTPFRSKHHESGKYWLWSRGIWWVWHGLSRIDLLQGVPPESRSIPRSTWPRPRTGSIRATSMPHERCVCVCVARSAGQILICIYILICSVWYIYSIYTVYGIDHILLTVYGHRPRAAR